MEAGKGDGERSGPCLARRLQATAKPSFGGTFGPSPRDFSSASLHFHIIVFALQAVRGPIAQPLIDPVQACRSMALCSEWPWLLSARPLHESGFFSLPRQHLRDIIREAALLSSECPGKYHGCFSAKLETGSMWILMLGHPRSFP